MNIISFTLASISGVGRLTSIVRLSSTGINSFTVVERDILALIAILGTARACPGNIFLPRAHLILCEKLTTLEHTLTIYVVLRRKRRILCG